VASLLLPLLLLMVLLCIRKLMIKDKLENPTRCDCGECCLQSLMMIGSEMKKALAL